MRRRVFITLLGGAAAWPLSARAQPGDRVRRVGVLMPYDENEPVTKTIVSAFTQAFAGLGWTLGRNVRMDLRWAGDDINRIRVLAHDLVGLQPDIILTAGTTATAAVQRETRTIHASVPDRAPRDQVAAATLSGAVLVSSAMRLICATAARPPAVALTRSSFVSSSSRTGMSARSV